MARRYYVRVYCDGGVGYLGCAYDNAEEALRKAQSELDDHSGVVVWMKDRSRCLRLVNYDHYRVEAAAYLVYCGEAGDEQGHFCGASESLRGARWIAGRARNEYNGLGWSLITNPETGERYVDGRTQL